MFANESRVLLILPQNILDHARVVAGKATTALKLPVSLQIVLRALIEEGLKREGDRRVFANIQAQAHAVRRIRSLARAAKRTAARHPGRQVTPSRRGGDGAKRRQT